LQNCSRRPCWYYCFHVAWLVIPLHWIWFVSHFLFHKPSTICIWFGFLSFLILRHLRPLVLLPPSGLVVLPTWILLARALAPAEHQVPLLMCQLQLQDLKVQAKERMVKFLVIIIMNIKQRWGIKVYRFVPHWTSYTGIQQNVCQILVVIQVLCVDEKCYTSMSHNIRHYVVIT